MSEGPTSRDGGGSDADATRPLSGAELTTDRAAIGRYQIERVLGRGGMGVVVAAHDPELDRRVAVKILIDHDKAPEVLGAALRREAQALARVHHGNVLSVYDAGVDGAPYLVMQLVEGETLGAHLARLRPPPRGVLELFLQAARGLAAIHAAGLIHRDFKPSNALVDTAGVVWVADLGLARIGELAQTSELPAGTASTQTNTIAGTPAYMAPEQFERRDLTAACDQFSFCVALWEALFGERPFRGDDLGELRTTVRTGAPREVRAEGVSKRQVQALQRGLALDPADRFPSMTALMAALSTRSRTPWVIGGGVLLAGSAAAISLVVAQRGSASPPVDAAVTAPAPATPPPLILADARRLTVTDGCDEYPSIGPDGTIYYDAVVGPDSHLMAIDPVTRTPRELTTTKGWDLSPEPSPDGKRIAFLRKTADAMAMYVADLSDLGSARRITLGGGRPAWSPDGKYIWGGGRSKLARFDAQTGAVERTVALPKNAFPMATLELPDGRVAVLTKTGAATADGLAIYDQGSTTSRWLIPASDDTPMDEVLTRAPSGDAVLVARYTVTANVEIWHVPLDGSPATVVSGAAINAKKHLALAGRRLVWSDCGEFFTIATMDLTSAGATKLTDLARNKWQDFQPAGVPGTDELVFLTERTAKDELWRMKRGGESPRVIPFGGLELDRIMLSHDGTLLAGANDDGLFVGPLDGSTPPRNVIPGDGGERNATFSRDNKRLFFERRDGERERIATAPVAGGKPTWLLPAGSLAPTQSPTADVLAYLVDEPATGPLQRTIMVLDQKTGATRKLAPAYPAYPFRELRFSPDGSRLLAIRRDGVSVEFEFATAKVLRSFDIGADQVLGATYLGHEIFVGRATSAGDIWEAELRGP